MQGELMLGEMTIPHFLEMLSSNEKYENWYFIIFSIFRILKNCLLQEVVGTLSIKRSWVILET